MKISIAGKLLLGVALASTALPSWSADAYPSRPVRFLVGFGAGGANDLVARLVATHLGPRLGQQVVVDNRPGAGGMIAHEILANATPDGQTMVLAAVSALAMGPALRGRSPYDSVRDFAPVAQVVDAVTLLSAHPSKGARSLKDFVDRAKREPGKLTVGNPGVGSIGHLAFELFNTSAGIKIISVPYKSGGLAATAAVGGQVEHLVGIISSGAPHVKAGRLRGLGVTSPKRSGALPDVPTIAEQGYPGFEASGWLGIAFPAGTPAPIIQRMYKEVAAVMASPEVQSTLDFRGLDLVMKNPEQFRNYIKAEVPRWEKLVKDAGLRAN
ncbi:MAG: Bug family tripartite tricarboxylate transporter substrate binding protein [Burkholderiales bacterium]